MQTSNSLRTRIKICGMTKPAQVADAVALGVDAIGMILHADSPRTISSEQAQLIRQVVPAFVTLVGVFVNADKVLIQNSARQIGLDLVQLHGDEDNDFGVELQLPFIKAIRVRTASQVADDCERFPDAQALLLDPYVAGQHGGTGESLDAALWPSACQLTPGAKKLVLAGGLSPDNVHERILSLEPYAVDFNSGLESEPGDKDLQRMRRAVAAVQQADTHRIKKLS